MFQVAQVLAGLLFDGQVAPLPAHVLECQLQLPVQLVVDVDLLVHLVQQDFQLVLVHEHRLVHQLLLAEMEFVLPPLPLLRVLEVHLPRSHQSSGALLDLDTVPTPESLLLLLVSTVFLGDRLDQVV